MMEVKAIFAGYKPDNASMARFLMSDRVADVANDAAEQIETAARANAIPITKTGYYASRFMHYGTTHSGEGLEGGPRRAAVVGNTAEYAAILELGPRARMGRGHRILTRAALPYHVPKGAVRYRSSQ